MPIGDVGQFYPANYLSDEDVGAKAGDQKNASLDLEKWYRYNQYEFDFKLMRKVTGLDISAAESYVDIGCGSGERVTFARSKGCGVSKGVDKFDFAKHAPRHESNIINSEVQKFRPAKKFQVASLFHVLEHVENPQEILTHIRKHILAKDGVIIVQVPNYGSPEAKFFGRKWFALDVPRHVWQFNDLSLMELMNNAGYRVRGIYKLNAALHPVTSVPSMFRELDPQRIWANPRNGRMKRKLLQLLWMVATLIAIPVNVVQNLLNQGTMLTIIASPKVRAE